jgi:hypothetical protein
MTTTFYKLHHTTNFAKECYVGSTSNYARRIIAHKTHCNNPRAKEFNYKVYKYIRTNSGFDNWDFTILEHVDNEEYSKIELLQMEMNFIEEHGASLNSNKPGALLALGRQAYNRQQQNDTDNLCNLCDTTYRGKQNKTYHQNTAKCKRLYALKLLQEAEVLE